MLVLFWSMIQDVFFGVGDKDTMPGNFLKEDLPQEKPL